MSAPCRAEVEEDAACNALAASHGAGKDGGAVEATPATQAVAPCQREPVARKSADRRACACSRPRSQYLLGCNGLELDSRDLQVAAPDAQRVAVARDAVGVSRQRPCRFANGAASGRCIARRATALGYGASHRGRGRVVRLRWRVRALRPASRRHAAFEGRDGGRASAVELRRPGGRARRLQDLARAARPRTCAMRPNTGRSRSWRRRPCPAAP